MKIEHWLTIAVIISQLIAPWLNGLFNKSRTAQPTPAPEANQPKNLTQRIWGWISSVLSSPWIMPPLVVASNIFWLHAEFRKTTPLSRMDVYRIAIDIAGILYGFVMFHLNMAWQSIVTQWAINREQRATNLEIIDLIKAVSETLKLTNESFVLALRLQVAQDESKRGRLPKLLAAIKDVFRK